MYDNYGYALRITPRPTYSRPGYQIFAPHFLICYDNFLIQKGESMDCPKCGTWNPEDKDVCWRCQEPLPKIVAKEKRKPIIFLGLPLWAWLVVLAIFFVPLLGQCLMAAPPAG
jgi:predicted nucleic acid-binding Zn ribbon protein